MSFTSRVKMAFTGERNRLEGLLSGNLPFFRFFLKVSPFLAFRKHLTFLGFTWKSHFSVFFLKISLFLDFLEHLTFLGFTWKSHIFMSYLKISPFLENLVFEQSPAGRESDLKTEYIVICKNVDSFPCLLLLNDSKLLKFWLLTYLCLIRHSHCIPIQPLSCTNSVQHGITWNKNFFIIRNLISAIVALRHPPNDWEKWGRTGERKSMFQVLFPGKDLSRALWTDPPASRLMPGVPR